MVDKANDMRWRQRVRDAVLARDRLVRAVLSGRRGSPQKIEIRPVELHGRPRVQINVFEDTRSTTRNLTPTEFRAEVDELLAMGWRTFRVDTTESTIRARFGKRGRLVGSEEPAMRSADRGHDRQKHRLLPPDAPFLKVLGVAGADGRIHADKQRKYRQIDTFLHLLERAATPGQVVRVADLGCGDAHLTFAAYHYFAAILGVEAHVTGVDVKDDAASRNNDRSRELGWTRLQFVGGRIVDYEPEQAPDVVLALHACDTATDDALARAILWRSRLILAAPCCHQHLQAQMSAPDEYSLLTRHGVALQRLGDLLTDALRASILRMHGYRTDVFEFVGSEHTAKNVMIRAVHTGSTAPPSEAARYRALCEQWKVTPKLEELLSGAP